MGNINLDIKPTNDLKQILYFTPEERKIICETGQLELQETIIEQVKIASCQNCGNFFEANTIRNIYCSDDKCNRDRQNKRQNKARLKKLRR